MTIREKGYHRWDGQLQEYSFRWLPIFLNGIKTVFKKHFAKSLFTFTVFPFLVFLVGIYVSTKPELKMFTRLVSLLNNEAAFFREFAGNGYLSFMLVVLGIFFGSELISGDIKFNSFPLYFSRPLNRKDYIAGKFSIIMFYFLLLTLVPNILLYLFKIIFTGKLVIVPQTIMALILFPILMSFLIASLILMISSLSGNTRYVRIITFLVYFFSEFLGNILYEIFRNPYFHAISLGNNLKNLSSFLFGVNSRFSYPGWLSLVIVIVLSAATFMVLNKRIARAEAQIESGN